MRGMAAASLGLGAITLMTSGCASLRPYDPGPGRRVTASVLDAAYLPGEPVNVTIANRSDVELLYPNGFCKTELQMKDRGGWVNVPRPSARCPIEVGFLDPNQTVVHQFHLPSDLAVGTYRFSIPMPVPEEPDAREAPLITPSFMIQGVTSRTPAVVAGANGPQ